MFVRSKAAGQEPVESLAPSILVHYNSDAPDSDLFDFSEQKKKIKQKRRKSFWLYHARKILILIISLMLYNPLILVFVGLMNSRFKFLKTVFVAYGASDEYALAYFYRWHMKFMRWKPWPVGIFCQDGKWGLMTGITSTEEDFYSDLKSEKKNLALLTESTVWLRDILKADQMTFAGILPGLLNAGGLLKETPETEVTLKAVRLALEALIKEVSKKTRLPVIILGGKGYLGRRIVKDLEGRGWDVYTVDIKQGSKVNMTDWPLHLNGHTAVLINVTKKAVLKNYVHLFWRGLVVLNETYPEPSRDEVALLTKKQCKSFHVVGIAAKSYPSFPKAYHGGIPCCAGWDSEAMTIKIKALN